MFDLLLKDLVNVIDIDRHNTKLIFHMEGINNTNLVLTIQGETGSLKKHSSLYIVDKDKSYLNNCDSDFSEKLVNSGIDLDLIKSKIEEAILLNV